MSYRNGSNSFGSTRHRSRHNGSGHDWSNARPGGRDDSPSTRRVSSNSHDQLKMKSDSPDRDYRSNPQKTLFIGRLSSETTEDQLRKHFHRFGDIRSLFLIRDVLTGESRRYAFIEYRHAKEADVAYAQAHNSTIDGKKILVDREFGRSMKDWKPRRGERPSDRQAGRSSFNDDARRPIFNSSFSRPSGDSNPFYHNARHDALPSNGRRNNDTRGRDKRGEGFNEGLRSRMHGSVRGYIGGRALSPPSSSHDRGRRLERR